MFLSPTESGKWSILHTSFNMAVRKLIQIESQTIPKQPEEGRMDGWGSQNW